VYVYVGPAEPRPPVDDLERRFPLPLPRNDSERRLVKEVVGAFGSRQDPGRDVRAVLVERPGRLAWVDVRYWVRGTPTATQKGVVIPLTDWRAFAQLISLVHTELDTRRLISCVGGGAHGAQ
jgi:hypothetical protein